MAHLEIACFSIESAIIAQQNGADRIELCRDFKLGGTTPTTYMVWEARKEVRVDMYIMIRPRGGNFTYSKSDFDYMKACINLFKLQTIDGFVFGILNKDKTINIKQNAELVQLAQPYPCTFHRAFDEAPDAMEALEQIIDCGFTTILTSGQAQNVTEGMNRLAELVTAASNRIVIMPGGGLRSSNIDDIQQATKAEFFHSSAITDGSETPNPYEILALKAKLK